MSLTSLWCTSRWINYIIVLLLYFEVWRKSSFDFGSKLRVLETRGKWTLEHDVSHDVYIYTYIWKKYIYIYIIAKVKFPKTYQCFIHIFEFYYFLYITLKLYKLRMTQNYIFEKVFII